MEKKKLSLLELMFMGVGQIIGSGIMVLLCVAIGMTGKGVAIGFLVTSVIIIIPLISLAALGSAIPNSGGMYTYVRDLIGKKAGFFYVALLVAGQLVLAQYALGISGYAAHIWPSVNARALAAIIMTLVFLINIAGLRTSVFVQRIVVIILVLSLLAFIGFGLPHVQNFGSFFSAKEILPNGLATFLSAAVLLRFSLIGGEFVSEFGGNCKNPGRDIPIAMIGSTLIVAVLYFLIAIVAAGVLPLKEVAFKDLAVVAEKILPHGLFIVFVIGGAIFALFSSLNSVFAWATHGIKQAIEDGWLPKGLAQENKRFGTPHWLLLMYYIIGMYPIVIGQEIPAISVIGSNIGLLFAGFPVFAIFFLAKKNPEAYKNAKFKLPLWLMYVVPIISVCIYIIGIASSWDWLKKTHAIWPMVIFCILVYIYTLIREKYIINKK